MMFAVVAVVAEGTLGELEPWMTKLARCTIHGQHTSNADLHTLSPSNLNAVGSLLVPLMRAN